MGDFGGVYGGAGEAMGGVKEEGEIANGGWAEGDSQRFHDSYIVD